MAHLDVVPVDESAPWQHPPFSAEVHDGAVWGRGTLDDKGCVVAISEAVERLLEQGFTPAQDVWLSFGCDEEVSGTSASEAVAELTRRGVEPWFVIDEGGAIAGDAFPGIKPPVGAIGVSEKGTTSVVLRVEGRGGHASTPARNGPTARLARAILQRRPAPDAVGGPGHDGRAVPPAGRARPAAHAAADAQRRAAPARCSPGPSSPPAPSRPR